MSCHDRLDTYLRENRVDHEFHRHEQAFTAQEVAAVEHVPGRMFAKTVMVNADGQLAMAVVPAPEHVDVSKVASALGRTSARLAEEKEFGTIFPDCDLGAMPAFGNLYGVPVVVDDRLAQNDRIVTQAGSHTETVTIPYADFARLVRPTKADIVQ